MNANYYYHNGNREYLRTLNSIKIIKYMYKKKNIYKHLYEKLCVRKCLKNELKDTMRRYSCYNNEFNEYFEKFIEEQKDMPSYEYYEKKYLEKTQKFELEYWGHIITTKIYDGVKEKIEHDETFCYNFYHGEIDDNRIKLIHDEYWE